MHVKIAAAFVFAGFLFIFQSFSDLPIHDPWFDIVVIGLFFAAFVGGMPDLEEDSPFWYVWIYRSSHLLLSMATQFFAHKSAWNSLKPQASLKGKGCEKCGRVVLGNGTPVCEIEDGSRQDMS